MVHYYYKINNQNNEDSFTQLIRVGNRTVEFHFQWAIVSEEQFGMVSRYLNRKADTDPILRRNGNYDRDYNWYSYYISLVGIDLGQWLDSQPELPVSLTDKPRTTQLSLLRTNIQAVLELQPAVDLYMNLLKWGFQMSCNDLDTSVGNVQPGGWYHSQDTKLSFRFTSEMETIGRDDISQVIIEFEVYDE